ncbi:hypothetical protein PVK06_034468 [Gossypium arboreum]|uniref:Uncharacterized protein n=1 Tax=Gossypium arboreum TaxID=29729 RepID=A0ABR0NE87_GOSAR|nr:hypothetical protein PVK06_034468 [Gossypium arboreum]
MRDILIQITKQNRWLTPAPLSDMFERFPPLGKEGTTDDEEETLIGPLDYERVIRPDHSSTKGMETHNPSQHSTAQTSRRQAFKASTRHERGKTPMEQLESKFG